MGEPTVAVVIPTHGGRFLPAAVASVQAQTVADWELIIVDDGSTDGTAAIAVGLAAQDARIRVVTNARNVGIAGARNRGLAATSPAVEYVAFVDHDDVWLPDALSALRAELVARPAASAAHGIVLMIDENGDAIPFPPGQAPRRFGLTPNGLREWPPDRPTELANLAYQDCISSTGSGLIRRTCLAAVGGFDPRAVPADDYDMWIRLARRGEIAFVPRPVLGYRIHAAQTSSRPSHCPRGQGTPYVQYKMITSPENTPAQRRLGQAGFRARQRDLFTRRYASLSHDWHIGELRRIPHHLFDLAARVAAYARGQPWSWHR